MGRWGRREGLYRGVLVLRVDCLMGLITYVEDNNPWG